MHEYNNSDYDELEAKIMETDTPDPVNPWEEVAKAHTQINEHLLNLLRATDVKPDDKFWGLYHAVLDKTLAVFAGDMDMAAAWFTAATKTGDD